MGKQILSSGASTEEMNSRVQALLSANKAGVGGVGHGGTNLSEAIEGGRMRVPGSIDENLSPGDLQSLRDKIQMRQAQSGARGGSVKRQSEIIREKKKSKQEEREKEGEEARKASYYRKVTGLRRAKVPMMVYSCGGFSRCFRVCRFYDVEGPPVGVEYEAPTPLKDSRNL